MFATKNSGQLRSRLGGLQRDQKLGKLTKYLPLSPLYLSLDC